MLNEDFIFHPFKLIGVCYLSVWKRVWIWCTCQVVGEAFTCNGRITWWTACGGITGLKFFTYYNSVIWLTLSFFFHNQLVSSLNFLLDCTRFIEPVQVLVSDINIGYEEIVNTQVIKAYSSVVTSMPFLSHFLQYIVAGSSNDNVCSALLRWLKLFIFVWFAGSCFQWSACKKFKELSDHGGKLQGWIFEVWSGVWPGIFLTLCLFDFSS